MDYLDKFEILSKIINDKFIINGKEYELKEEFDKYFIKSNKSAGRRIRKIMSEIKKMANEIKTDVNEYGKRI